MTNAATIRTGQPVRMVLGSVRAAPYRVAALVVGALAADQAFDPDRTHVPFCPLHALTGIWCPFCGGLRSAYELTRLHVRTALHDNVVFVAALPLLALMWLDWVWRARHGRPRRALPRHAIMAVVVIAVVFTIVRNLPWFGALRPVN